MEAIWTNRSKYDFVSLVVCSRLYLYWGLHAEQQRVIGDEEQVGKLYYSWVSESAVPSLDNQRRLVLINDVSSYIGNPISIGD